MTQHLFTANIPVDPNSTDLNYCTVFCVPKCVTLQFIFQYLYIIDDSEHNSRGRASLASKPPTFTVGPDDADAEGDAWLRRQGRSRRTSRVTRQHSYDDELKNISGSGSGGGQGGGGEPGLGKWCEYL